MLRSIWMAYWDMPCSPNGGRSRAWRMMRLRMKSSSPWNDGNKTAHGIGRRVYLSLKEMENQFKWPGGASTYRVQSCCAGRFAMMSGLRKTHGSLGPCAWRVRQLRGVLREMRIGLKPCSGNIFAGWEASEREARGAFFDGS